MSILDRYTLRQFLGMFLGSLLTLSLLFTGLSVLDGLTFLSRYGMSTGAIIHYYMLQLPQTIFMSAPVAALLSAMITLAGMNQNQELTAMRAAGRSLARIALPMVGAAFLISGGLFVMGNTLVPKGNRAFLSAKQEALANADDPTQKVWYLSEGKDRPPTILRISRVDRKTGRLTGVTALVTGPDFALEAELVAAAAEYHPGQGWKLLDVERRSFHGFDPPVIERLAELDLALPDTPEDLLEVQRAPEEMTWSELNRQIRRVQRYGLSVTAYRVERHARGAIPLAAVVLVLVGVPLAIRPVRSGGLAVGILGAIIIGFVYFLIIAEFIAMGKGAILSPGIAAWTANLIFGAIGLAGFAGLRR
jgi:lipopolysaccharide export system permease protein